MTKQTNWVAALLVLCCATVFSSGEAVAADGAPSASAGGKDGAMMPLRSWRRIRSFKTLERAILEGVKLDAAQKKTFTTTFAALYKRMADDPRKAGMFPEAYSVYSPKELKVQQSRLKAAQDAGKTKLAKDIQSEIDKHSAGSGSNLTPIPEDIVDELAKVLRGDQIASYQKVTERWKTLKPSSPIDGPFPMLVRAVRDPELKLSVEQQTVAYGILGKAQTAVRKNHDPANVAKLSQEAYEKIKKDLPANQRAHLTKTLSGLAQERKAIREYGEKWFGGRGKAMPDHLRHPTPWEK